MKSLAVIVALGAALATAAPALAQAPGQGARTDLGGTQGKETFSVRGHVSVWGAMGLDLDVIGNVTAGAVGTIRGTGVLIDATAYPDVYVRTQRRRSVGVGFGIFDRTELFARYQDANNPAATVVIGQFGSSSQTFGVGFDNYKDRLVEFGLRKYIASPKASREYFALVGGMKTVEPIGMTMQVPGGNVQAALYDKSRVLALGLEFGITVEYHKVGVFAETGFRFQKRLARNSGDLEAYGLQDLNHTGIRLFMPATLGLLVRF
jgi:hypothetical protein